ncbi:hypothetical protein BDK92_5468 [Micromonospora pisi]|uniref:Nucleotidyltransferase-like protein n=1 Tax=Micromonospora pisi TaxID=589240 RepID=A0A495JQ14_9ACTN|nr:hypothetical protein [Micromonospora pisi]RKR91080.1 hypothetical protein BDK92_5468 [Micromonospora pisi]
MSDLSTNLGELTARGLVPADCRAAFVVGSFARGWANASSDVDMYLVCDQAWRSATNGVEYLPLEPAEVATEVVHVGGQRWELKYWLEAQVDQMIDKVSWASFETGLPTGQILTTWEEEFVERMLTCRPLTGEDWVLRQRAKITSSAFRAFVVADCLSNADDCLEDVMGQLASGDVESALLSVRLGFGHAVDALLASQGEYGRAPKWRARRVREVNPPLLPFERYWAVETMRAFDPAEPRQWIQEIADLCKSLSMEVEI